MEDSDDAECVAVVVHGAEVARRPDLQHVGDSGGAAAGNAHGDAQVALPPGDPRATPRRLLLESHMTTQN